MSHWANWAGNVKASPRRQVRPGSEEEIVELLRSATAQKEKVRPVGSGHSFQPLCATDDLLLSLEEMTGVIESGPDWALIRAGTRLGDLGEELHRLGLGMENLGDIDRQGLAGAVSTGTHGTGPGLGSLATQVTGLRLITSDGAILDLDRKNEPRFDGMVVSLGALGVVTRIRLRLLPRYRLHERSWALDAQVCLDSLEELIGATRHFEFFWLPGEDLCACKALHPAEGPISVEETGVDLDPRLARYIGSPRVDWSHRIFPSVRDRRFVEMEYAVPARSGPDAFAEIRWLMQERHAYVRWPVEYRTLAADPLWLSPAFERDTVTISVHQAVDEPYADFFADAESVFRRYDGRPHWGKVHGLGATDFKAIYPQWGNFLNVRRELDPAGTFLNRHLEEILHQV